MLRLARAYDEAAAGRRRRHARSRARHRRRQALGLQARHRRSWARRWSAWAGAATSRTRACLACIREAPVNSIWEGSGNVICLDVLRALRAGARVRWRRSRRSCGRREAAIAPRCVRLEPAERPAPTGDRRGGRPAPGQPARSRAAGFAAGPARSALRLGRLRRVPNRGRRARRVRHAAVRARSVCHRGTGDAERVSLPASCDEWLAPGGRVPTIAAAERQPLPEPCSSWREPSAGRRTPP